MAPERGALARPAAHADWYRLTANHITAKGGPTDTLINPGWGLFVGHRWIPHPAISGTTSATGGDSLMAIDRSCVSSPSADHIADRHAFSTT